MLRKLVLLALVGAVAVVGDLVAEQRAEAAVEAAIESRVERVGSVDAAVTSFPFLGRLAASGRVEQLELHLRDVAEQSVTVADLYVDARGIRLSRQVLLGESRVRITDVDSVAARMTVTEDEIRRATGVPVELEPGMPVPDVPLPATDLLPCEPEVEVVQDAVEASCTADRLPRIVVDAVGSTELRGR